MAEGGGGAVTDDQSVVIATLRIYPIIRSHGEWSQLLSSKAPPPRALPTSCLYSVSAPRLPAQSRQLMFDASLAGGLEGVVINR